MQRGAAERLMVILEVIGLLEERLGRMSYAAFERDRNEIDLAAYRLQVIGEESHHLPADLKARHAAIDWRAMYAMRNLISHNYGAIVPRAVWQAATEDLEPLAAVCRTEVARLSP